MPMVFAITVRVGLTMTNSAITPVIRIRVDSSDIAPTKPSTTSSAVIPQNTLPVS